MSERASNWIRSVVIAAVLFALMWLATGCAPRAHWSFKEAKHMLEQLPE